MNNLNNSSSSSLADGFGFSTSRNYKTLASIKETFEKHNVHIDDEDTKYYVEFVGLCDTSYEHKNHVRKYCANMFDMEDGGIDHQSCPMAGAEDPWVANNNKLPKLMINDPEGFYNFIMSKDTYINVDNDNG